mmetsp:Transcript_114378/g.180642  ORF Transcript_114378/g.180642 Transcript_114378/m.180642 type:complete len:133 (+) Transcript_114378:42-440(+)
MQANVHGLLQSVALQMKCIPIRKELNFSKILDRRSKCNCHQASQDAHWEDRAYIKGLKSHLFGTNYDGHFEQFGAERGEWNASWLQGAPLLKTSRGTLALLSDGTLQHSSAHSVEATRRALQREFHHNSQMD